jgi:hypothetical protein
MVHQGRISNSLWHSSTADGSWTRNVKIPGQTSKRSPGMASQGGRLHLVHLGNSSNDIWYTKFDGRKWSKNVKIRGQKSKETPELVVFRNQVHMVHLGSSSNRLWHSVLRRGSWTQNVKIPNHWSSHQPAMAVFQGKIHMVHKGTRSKNLWHSTYDGSRWSRPRKIAAQKTKNSPALAVHGGVLQLVHPGASSNNIWYAQYDGRSWTSNVQVPQQTSKDASVLASFGNRLHLLHIGNSSNNIWHSTGDGVLSVVRIGIKVLVNPVTSINTMLANMRRVYATRGYLVQEATARQSLNLTALETLDVGSCRMGSTTNEQDQLFRNRRGLRNLDVAVYFVRSTVPAYNGCAAHPNNVPACVVARGASQWTLGHEVGHVLSLRHVDNNDRLMTGNGTFNITNPPPDITANEGVKMGKSRHSIE